MEACDFCNKEFKSTALLKEHFKTHISIVQSIEACDVCGINLSDSAHRKEHMKMHTEEKQDIQTCDLCGNAFTDSTQLKEHIKSHREDEPDMESCDFCYRKFSNFYQLKEHIKTHIDKELITETCNDNHKQSSSSQHKEPSQTNRGEESNIDSNDTSELEISSTSLHKEHTCSKADTTKNRYNFRCEICNLGFVKLSDMKTHISSHTGEGKLSCEICGKEYGSGRDLRKHIITHEISSQIRNVCKTNGGGESTTDASEYNFRCEICDLGFRKLSDMNIHVSSHIGGEIFTCEICKEKFSSVFGLKKHLRKHHKTSPQKQNMCMLCGKKFKFELGLHRHLKTHTSDQTPTNDGPNQGWKSTSSAQVDLKPEEAISFKCIACDQDFSLFTDFQKHILTHEGGNQSDTNDGEPRTFSLLNGQNTTNVIYDFRCEICDQGYKSINDLQTHIDTHSGMSSESFNSISPPQEIALHKCIICDREFPLFTDLQKHTINHEGCAKDFVKTALLKKKKSSCARFMPYVCSICGKHFSKMLCLSAHLRTHKGKKSCQCGICGKEFSRSCHLPRHIRSHKSTNQYRCDICGKEFTVKGHFLQHHKTHSKVKPDECSAATRAPSKSDMELYKCGICGQEFTRKSKLILHTKIIHTVVEQYHNRCDICGKTFTSKCYLEKHRKKHESRQPLQCGICGNVYLDKYYFQKHVNKHKDVKQNRKPGKAFIKKKKGRKQQILETCDKMVYDPGHLQVNVRWNLKPNTRKKYARKKPFKCITCGERFSRKVRFLAHDKTHTELKPNKCNKEVEKSIDSSRRNVRIGSLSRKKPDIETLNEQFFDTVTTYLEQCNFSNEEFSDQTEVEAHIKTHTGKTSNIEKCDENCSKDSAQLQVNIGLQSERKPDMEMHDEQVLDTVTNFGHSNLCSEEFGVQTEFEAHIKMHTDEESNMETYDKTLLETETDLEHCDFCSEVFSDRMELKAHIKTHTGEESDLEKCDENNSLNSDQLQVSMGSKSERKTDIDTHDQQLLETVTDLEHCDFCSEVFSDRTELKTHIKTHTLEEFNMERCDKNNFVDSDQLNVSTGSHSGRKPVMETHDANFSPGLLKFRTGHYSIRKSNTTSDSSRLGVNNVTNRGNKKVRVDSYNDSDSESNESSELKKKNDMCPTKDIYNFKCNICKQGFIRKTDMIKHVNNHMGVKTIFCVICGKDCKTSFELAQHVQTHKPQPHISKKNACKYCGKEFKLGLSLQRHLQTHEEQQLRTQNVSDKGSSSSPRAQNKNTNQSNPKPHQENRCVICNKAFPHVTLLELHFQMHLLSTTK